jgi:hypothetical protein
MTQRMMSLAALALMIAATAVRAEEKMDVPDGNQGMTVAQIEERKQKLNAELSKRIENLDKLHAERVALEKKMVGERIAFLDTLKTMNPADQKAALESFNQNQKGEREAFRTQRKDEWRENHPRREAFRQERREKRAGSETPR